MSQHAEITEITVHIMRDGNPLCRFTLEVPSQWPVGNIWISELEAPDTRAACKDPCHPLNCVLQYRMCEGCEAELHLQGLVDIPIIPTEGRTCEACGAPLVPTWPAVYCSNECALADSGLP